MDSTIITVRLNSDPTRTRKTSKFTATRSEQPKARLTDRAAVFDRAVSAGAAARSDVSDKDGKPLPRLPDRKAGTTAQQPTPESSPRSVTSLQSPKHRPLSLSLSSTNGYTERPGPELKQQICHARTDDTGTVTRTPTDNRQPLPPTPTSPIMGNKPSSINGSPTPDDKSARSVVHVRNDSKPMSGKSSYNLFKRVDSRSPLPRDVTASVMSIIHRDERGNEGNATEDADLVSAAEDLSLYQQHSYNTGYPVRTSSKLPPATSVTVTESRAAIPLSASTTIHDLAGTSQAECERKAAELAPGARIPPAEAHPTSRMLSNLSPTIPAPSPLPEDSPHKYGLRDHVETPEMPDAPENITLPKARRKSSGLEIFNEAKNLQSASSFLNGLSTSRRRAESAAAIHESTASDSSWTGVTVTKNATSRPSSAHPPSRPTTAYQDNNGRRKGHNFKPSGFAYTRPLALTQVKCYRNHGCLLVSGNKHASVECAVCRIDDDGDHFCCTWCALRMCKFCRKDFGERGMSGLRERIKIAEMGGRVGSSTTSSSDSLVELAMVGSDYV